MFAREVENAKVKCNENLWPSMEDRGGDRGKKSRRKKEVRKQKHG
jgi:hypothetical protein